MPIIAAAAIAGTAALVGAGVQYMGSKKAAKAAAAAAAKQQAIYDALTEELDKIGIPPVEAQKLYLENPELVYQYVPKLQQIEELPDSAFEDVEVDPRLMSAQMDALESLRERSVGGLTPEDEAEINKFRRQAAGEAEAQRATTLQRMEQRGLGGSGAELATQLASQQQIAQTRAEQADEQASLNYQAKMDALSQMGNLATSLRSQDVAEQTQKAQAQDALEQFNLQQRQTVRQANIERENAAAKEMALMKQQQENQRAALANQQQEYNKELLAKQYQQELDKMRIKTGLATGQAAAVGQSGVAQSNNINAQYGAIGQGISSVGQTAGTAYGQSSSSSDDDLSDLDDID